MREETRDARLAPMAKVQTDVAAQQARGDGLGSVHASGKSGALCKGLLTYLKHGNSVVAINSVQTAIAAATVADNAEVKSP